MIFVRYKGGARVGRFTEGSIYLAEDALQSSSAVSDSFHVRDDYGGQISFKRAEGCFDVLDEVCACCVAPVAGVEPGDVFLVDGAGDGMLSLVGVGWLNAKNFEVVDGSNLAVDSYVQETTTGRWLPVREIDGIGVRVNGDPALRPLNDFRLPVSDGSITTVPLATCQTGDPGLLTEGKEYLVTWEDGKQISVLADDGTSQTFDVARFTKNR
jgi:hypothetical protein